MPTHMASMCCRPGADSRSGSFSSLPRNGWVHLLEGRRLRLHKKLGCCLPKPKQPSGPAGGADDAAVHLLGGRINPAARPTRR